MARGINPYHAEAGQYNAIGQGVNNLANAFLTLNDPARQAKGEALAWRARESRENVIDTQDARQGRHSLGDILRTFDPQADNRALYASGVGSGALDPAGLNTLFRGMTANFGGSDDQTLRSVIGAGGTVGENDAFSLGDREAVAERNAVNDIRLDTASQSINEVLGGKLRSGEIGMGELFRSQYPNRYASADKTRAEAAAGGDPFGLSAGQKRYREALDGFREQLSPMLVSLGVPMDNDGNVRTDLLPPGYFEEAIRIAADAARADQFNRADEYYLENALRQIGQVPTGYEEDASNIPFYAPEELTLGAPSEPVDAHFARLFQQAQPGAAQPGTAPPPSLAQPGAQPDPTLQEAVAAITRGADPAAVRDRLFQMGYTDDQLEGAGL